VARVTTGVAVGNIGTQRVDVVIIGAGLAGWPRRGRWLAGAVRWRSWSRFSRATDREGPFVVCSPCSGHGAKFAPLVGQIAADLACDGDRPDPRFTLAAHRG
jgi:hypothetical protein